MVQRQEIHCHNCDKWVQFEIDLDLDGNHVLNCPNCDHEHCRVVRKGVITDIRWDSRNGPTYTVIATSTSSASAYVTVATAVTGSDTSYFTTDMWRCTITYT